MGWEPTWLSRGIPGGAGSPLCWGGRMGLWPGSIPGERQPREPSAALLASPGTCSLVPLTIRWHLVWPWAAPRLPSLPRSYSATCSSCPHPDREPYRARAGPQLSVSTADTIPYETCQAGGGCGAPVQTPRCRKQLRAERQLLALRSAGCLEGHPQPGDTHSGWFGRAVGDSVHKGGGSPPGPTGTMATGRLVEGKAVGGATGR